MMAGCADATLAEKNYERNEEELLDRCGISFPGNTFLEIYCWARMNKLFLEDESDKAVEIQYSH